MILKSSMAGLLISLLAVFGGGEGDEEKKHEKNFVFVTSNSSANVNINGHHLMAEDMEIGETRTFEGDDGEITEITRDENGFSIVKGDKTTRIDLSVDADHTGVRIIADGEEIDLSDVTDMGMNHFVSKNDMVNISGLGDIDEDMKDRIRAALRDAGVEKEIGFDNHKVMWFGQDGSNFNLSGKSFFFSSDDDEDSEANVQIKSGNGKVFVIKKKKELH